MIKLQGLVSDMLAEMNNRSNLDFFVHIYFIECVTWFLLPALPPTHVLSFLPPLPSFLLYQNEELVLLCFGSQSAGHFRLWRFHAVLSNFFTIRHVAWIFWCKIKFTFTISRTKQKYDSTVVNKYIKIFDF